MNKFYFSLLVVIGAQYSYTYGMVYNTGSVSEPIFGNSGHWAGTEVEEVAYNTLNELMITRMITDQDQKNYQTLISSLPKCPHSCLRAIAASGHNLTPGYYYLIAPHINHALAQGGQFYLSDIDRSAIFKLIRLAVENNEVGIVKAILKTGNLISPDYNKSLLSGKYDDHIPKKSLLSYCFNTLDQNGEITMFELLISFGADINKDRGHSEMTLLHLAVKYSNPSLTKYLLDAGARADVEDEWGRSPLTIARKKLLQYRSQQFDEIVKLLEERQKKDKASGAGPA